MWFPRAVNTARGGFDQNFAEDWSKGEGDERSLVYQARLTWVAAQASQRFPQEAERYRNYARHGLAFLHRMEDTREGGFFWELDGAGHPARDGEKHVYGIAFALYALSATYEATHDPQALKLAQRAFTWLDTHTHDAKNGGYVEALRRDGTPILAPSAAPDAPTADFIGTRYGFKSMNTHIHLLEALAELFRVWPDVRVKSRLSEVFDLVRETIVVPPVGAMNLFFTPQWRAVPDHDSFGHDVETAYLLVEASHALGRRNDARTWEVARRLVDHALQFGWDAEHGGFYDAGGTFTPPTARDKVWWVEAEGLNALLLMHSHFGKTTPRYEDAFLRQWQFIATSQIDSVHGGWYPSVSEEGKPLQGRAKSDAWTEAYHQGRALLNVSAMLRQMALESAPTR